MSMLYLILAIILEVSGTTCMKLSQGFTKIGASLLMFIFYGFSLGALTLALKKIDVGIAYAVWSGIGTTLIAAVGVLWFNEPVTAIRIISIGLIIIGVVSLYLTGEIH
ncbi:MAG: multidrug efflux SMR transporter [Nitrospinae bacterium]|nr:multidrug efflux SMR transporter [Nitrospinota bacterium]MBI3812899.1 multidrug efflux SMR transporter [Nitrospinota bacterium]